MTETFQPLRIAGAANGEQDRRDAPREKSIGDGKGHRAARGDQADGRCDLRSPIGHGAVRQDLPAAGRHNGRCLPPAMKARISAIAGSSPALVWTRARRSTWTPGPWKRS